MTENEMSKEEQAKKENQMQVFLDMLRQLERDGNCKEVYHALAESLFGDRLD